MNGRKANWCRYLVIFVSAFSISLSFSQENPSRAESVTPFGQQTILLKKANHKAEVNQIAQKGKETEQKDVKTTPTDQLKQPVEIDSLKVGSVEVDSLKVDSSDSSQGWLFTDVFRSGKNIWDWLDLLIIPILLAVLGFFIQKTLHDQEQERKEQQDKLERERKEQQDKLERERHLQEILKNYLDRMTQLLLDPMLPDLKSDKQAQIVARAITLTVLEELDGKSKGSLIRFLSQANLIQCIDLNQANLREARLENVNLSQANLTEADLGEAHLTGVILSKAILVRADLRKAHIERAFLSEASLWGAKIGEADLSNATLSDTELVQANLSKAKLRKADLRNTNLKEANLQDTDLVDAQNLTSQQIKSACNWEKGTYKALPADNQKFIEDLKNDNSSDPATPVDCTLWNRH
jgi:hypothetical protein